MYLKTQAVGTPYMAKLPVKEDVIINLEHIKDTTLKRLQALERCLKRNRALRIQ